MKKMQKKTKAVQKIEAMSGVVLHGIQCPHCQEVIVSLSDHDFRQCKCGKTFIDGGFSYLRAGGTDLATIKHVDIRLTEDYLGSLLKHFQIKTSIPTFFLDK